MGKGKLKSFDRITGNKRDIVMDSRTPRCTCVEMSRTPRYTCVMLPIRTAFTYYYPYFRESKIKRCLNIHLVDSHTNKNKILLKLEYSSSQLWCTFSVATRDQEQFAMI